MTWTHETDVTVDAGNETNGVAVAPDGSFLITGRNDHIEAWSIDTDPLSFTHETNFGSADIAVIRDLAIDDDVEYVASGDAADRVDVFSIDTDPLSFTHETTFSLDNDAWRVDFGGGYLFAGSLDNNLHSWEMDDPDPANWTHATVNDTAFDESVNSVDYNAAKNLVAGSILDGDDLNVVVYDVDTFDLEFSSDEIGTTRHSRGISWHPSGDYLAHGTSDNTVEFYDCRDADPSNWSHASTRTQPSGAQRATIFTPDGEWVLSTGSDNDVYVYDIDDDDPDLWSFDGEFPVGDNGRNFATAPGVGFVAAGNDTDDLMILTYDEQLDPAFFEVEILSTNSPVEEGETLEVEYEVTNTGGETDTQDVRLFIDPD